MSETPRTDKVMRDSSADAGSAWLEMRDHARALETSLLAACDRNGNLSVELAAAKAELASLREAVNRRDEVIEWLL